MLQRAGLNADRDVTVVLGGDVPTQLQALVNGSIQVGILSPPTVIVARDKYKMNILAGAMDEFTSLQNGLAVSDRSLRDQRELVKRILRARAKGNRWRSAGSSEVLAKYLNVEISNGIGNLPIVPSGIYDEWDPYGRRDQRVLEGQCPDPRAFCASSADTGLRFCTASRG